MELQEQIRSFLLEHGAGQVGFCCLEEDNLFSLPYAISYTIPLSDAIVEQIDTTPTHTYFHHYRSVNALIDQLSLRAGRMLADAGYQYVPIPASQSVHGLQGIFSHKYAATRAGLGSVGKSGLFLSSFHGPRVRLGTILTDCPFPDSPTILDSPCRDCNLCARSCPAMAISGKAWEAGAKRDVILDARACSDYMKSAFQHIGRGVVCGICMKVCPKGGNLHAKDKQNPK